MCFICGWLNSQLNLKKTHGVIYGLSGLKWRYTHLLESLYIDVRALSSLVWWWPDIVMKQDPCTPWPSPSNGPTLFYLYPLPKPIHSSSDLQVKVREGESSGGVWVGLPGRLLHPKLGINCGTDWESGSRQSSYRRGGHMPIALHLEVLYKIRWLQWPYLNRITELQKEVSTYISQNNVWDNFYWFNTFWWEAVGKLAKNWTGGYTYVLDTLK